MENGCRSIEKRTVFATILAAVTLGVWWIAYSLHKSKRSDSIFTKPLSESVQVVCEPQPRRNSILDWANLAANLAAVVAVLIAAAALHADIQEVQQMRAEITEMQQYNRLSAVPHVTFERILVQTSSYPAPGLYLINHGPGLAVLESYKVYVDDIVVPEGWKAVIRMLELDDLPGFRFSTLANTLPPGPEFRVMLVGFETDSFTSEIRDRWVNSLSRLRMEITYKSVYGQQHVAILQKRDSDE